MVAPTALQPTYVLHHRPWRDTSLIVDVWCMHTGRQTLIVRGARKAQGKQPAKRSMLQPFHPLQLNYSGRGDMGYAQQIEWASAPIMLHGKALYCGMYINELILKLLPLSDPYADLFAYYQEALNRLAAKADEEQELRRFENRLLEELGYQVDLNHDLDHHQPINGQYCYEFFPLQGVRQYMNTTDHPIINSHQKTRFLIQGLDLLALNQGQLHQVAIKRLSKAIARANLDKLLDGKLLRSRELFRQMVDNNPSKL